MLNQFKPSQIRALIKKGQELPLAIENYPSRGQTAVQKIYATKLGKLFLKRVSERNHQECQINTKSGTLAQREYWSYQLASQLGLEVPQMALVDKNTTVQTWLDIPDAHHFLTDQGPLKLDPLNVFECACFDWLTGQIDRHDANYLYDFVRQKIILIDSAHAFLKYEGSLPHYLQIFEVGFTQKLTLKVDLKILKALKKIQSSLKNLVPLKDKAELYFLEQRANQLLELKNIKQVIHLYRASHG